MLLSRILKGARQRLNRQSIKAPMSSLVPAEKPAMVLLLKWQAMKGFSALVWTPTNGKPFPKRIHVWFQAL